MMDDYVPNALEALRPNQPCSNADLVRFLNFTDALNQWWIRRKKYFAETNPAQTVRLGYWLYVRTIDLWDKLHGYDRYTRDGKIEFRDEAFMALFPEKIPLGDGTEVTWDQIFGFFEHIRANVPPVHPSTPASAAN